jgi:hypothetical protein
MHFNLKTLAAAGALTTGAALALAGPAYALPGPVHAGITGTATAHNTSVGTVKVTGLLPTGGSYRLDHLTVIDGVTITATEGDNDGNGVTGEANTVLSGAGTLGTHSPDGAVVLDFTVGRDEALVKVPVTVGTSIGGATVSTDGTVTVTDVTRGRGVGGVFPGPAPTGTRTPFPGSSRTPGPRGSRTGSGDFVNRYGNGLDAYQQKIPGLVAGWTATKGDPATNLIRERVGTHDGSAVYLLEFQRLNGSSLIASGYCVTDSGAANGNVLVSAPCSTTSLAQQFYLNSRSNLENLGDRLFVTPHGTGVQLTDSADSSSGGGSGVYRWESGEQLPG